MPWAYKVRQKSVAQLVLAPWGRAVFCQRGTPRNTQNSDTGTHGVQERCPRTQGAPLGPGARGILPPSLALATRDIINGFFFAVGSENLLLTRESYAPSTS